LVVIKSPISPSASIIMMRSKRASVGEQPPYEQDLHSFIHSLWHSVSESVGTRPAHSPSYECPAPLVLSSWLSNKRKIPLRAIGKT